MVEEVKGLIDFVQTIGFTGLLIVLAIPRLRSLVFGYLQSSGRSSADIPRLRSLVFGNGTEDLKKYYNHSLTEKLDGMGKKLDKVNSHLDDIRVNGVRIKKD